MSLLGNLMSKIFSHAPAAAATTSAPAPAAAAAPVTSSAAPPTAQAAAPPAQAPASPQPSSAPAAPAQPKAPVDVTAILDGLAAKNSEKLDWKRSIVDLMKLVGIDSSFSARKELAKELNYTGDPNDSASMNVWLHKQVLTKIAENGGKLPAELLAK